MTARPDSYAKSSRRRSTAGGDAEPGNAIISSFVGQHAAGVNEYAHMRIEAIFDAAASLGEPLFERIEMATATAKDVGSESALAQRETQRQVGRGAVYEGSAGVFGIRLGAKADIPGEEVIDPRSGTQPGVVPDPRVGKVINGVFPHRSSPEPVQGQFVGPIKIARIVIHGVLTQDRHCGQHQDGSSDNHCVFHKFVLHFWF